MGPWTPVEAALHLLSVKYIPKKAWFSCFFNGMPAQRYPFPSPSTGNHFLEKKNDNHLHNLCCQTIKDQDGVEFSIRDKRKLELKLEELKEDCGLCEKTLTAAKETLDETQWEVQKRLFSFLLINPLPLLGKKSFTVGYMDMRNSAPE